MKTKSIIILIVAAFSPVAMLAQSPSPSVSRKTQREDIMPPTPPNPPAPPRDNRPKEPVTFLGVETSPVPRVVSEQLGLPKGFGLVVDYVVPDSPAAAAGVQQNDIMRMLNDQILLEPGQLGKLVRSFNEGATINLTLLRKGKEIKVTPKLTKHEMPAPHGPFGMGFDHEWKFDDGFGKMNMDFRDLDLPKVHEDVKKARREADLAGDETRRAARQIRIFTKDDGTMKATKIDLGKAQIVFSDKQGELKLETVDGKKILTAKDAQGRLLFSGP
ncbi:MAG: PDZ domain-containing protein, partial [Verrucomicrobiota bacterium]